MRRVTLTEEQFSWLCGTLDMAREDFDYRASVHDEYEPGDVERYHALDDSIGAALGRAEILEGEPNVE